MDKNKTFKSKKDALADRDTKISRRGIFELGSTALAAVAVAAPGKAGGSTQEQQPNNHNAPNETDPGPKNRPLATENPDSVWPPKTDNGSVKPFKYSFALSRK